jgi:hypothetical protein
MAGRGEFHVRTDSLREFRRDLRRLPDQLEKEANEAEYEGVVRATRAAALLAPRITGALAGSYEAYRRGGVSGTRSTLPYAGVIEYTQLSRRSAPVTRAVMRETDQIVEEFEDAVERAADRTGWR